MHTVALGRHQRWFVTAAAWLGWAGLAIQLYLILSLRWAAEASLVGGLVNFFSFFTVLSNTLVAVVLTCHLSARNGAARRFFLQPWVSSGVAVSIVVVAVAYSLLLRHLWQTQGWQRVADQLLHDVMPLLFAFYWWRWVPKGRLRVAHVALWAAYPLLYFGAVLLRGESVGLYPYPFIDVGKLGYPQVLLNAVGILLGFVAVGLALVALDRFLWARARPR